MTPAENMKAALEKAREKMTSAANDVLAERERQQSAEGWTADHDAGEHQDGDLARAAACYAVSATCADENQLVFGGHPVISRLWPWDFSWWKRSTPRRDLVKAGALILAEIERMDREALAAIREALGET